jgi:hypothetical protein
VRAVCATLGVSAEPALAKCREKFSCARSWDPPEMGKEWVGRSSAELREVWGWVRGQGWFEAGQAGGPRDLPAEWTSTSPWLQGVLHSVSKMVWADDDPIVREAQAILGGELPWDLELIRQGSTGVSGTTRVEVGSVEAEAMALCVCENIMMGAIRMDPPCNGRPPRFESPLFVVDSGGKKRIIHDCRRVNDFLQKASVKFESVQDALSTDIHFAAKLDLKEAFKQVKVSPQDAKALGFSVGHEGWREGLSGEFSTLPLGMSHSPQRMVGALEPAIAAARRAGVRLAWYLDDILVVGATEFEVAWGTATVVACLARWGFRVSDAKFYPYICSKIDFLGFIIDFKLGTIGISEEKREKLVAEAERLLGVETVLVKDVQKFLGRIGFAFSVVRLSKALRRAMDGDLALALALEKTQYALSDLAREELQQLKGMECEEWCWDWRKEMRLRETTPLVGWTDAGPTGCGCLIEGLGEGFTAWWDADMMVCGVSSAALEIKGITALIIGYDLKNVFIRIYGDAQAAIRAVVAGKGRAAGTSMQVALLLKEVRRRGLALDLEWVSRADGLLPYVDALARLAGTRSLERTAEWGLSDEAFGRSMRVLGARPTVDLFARKELRKLDRWCAQVPAHGAVGTGLGFPLEGECPYIFAPWSQLGKALKSL